MRPYCAVVATVLLTLAPPPVRAQGLDESSIVGTIRDATRAVIVNAEVTLSGANLIGGPRRMATSGDGSYRFTALPPGEYDIQAEFRGFRPAGKRGVRLPAGGTIVVDVVLDVAGISNTLQVDAASLLIDVRSAGIPTHLDQNLLQSLPTSRWLPSVINVLPGVAGDVAFGGTQGSNGMYVDGVDITNPHEQDAIGRFNYNWIQEVQVVGLGAPAQYGEFTGVSARSVVRSGSNRFSGLAEYLDDTSELAGAQHRVTRGFARTFIRIDEIAGVLGQQRAARWSDPARSPVVLRRIRVGHRRYPPGGLLVHRIAAGARSAGHRQDHGIARARGSAGRIRLAQFLSGDR